MGRRMRAGGSVQASQLALGSQVRLTIAALRDRSCLRFAPIERCVAGTQQEFSVGALERSATRRSPAVTFLPTGGNMQRALPQVLIGSAARSR